MKSRQYQNEELRRYQEQLDAMSPIEFAQEGLRHLMVTFIVIGVIAAFCGCLLWVTDEFTSPPAVILGAIGFCLPFMLLEWWALKRQIKKYNGL